jgi:hypothetical protein
MTARDVAAALGHARREGRDWRADCPVHCKPQVDKDGQHKRDVNGKPAYRPVLEWRDRDLSDRFSAAVVDLIRASHPDALQQ